MNCCQCNGIEELFNEKNVSRELSQYRKKGADQTTRIMIDALKKEGIQGLTLLDIGGGVGAIQHALLEAGAQQAIDVDASRAYLKAAKEEANRRGLAERVTFRHGNFIDLADQVPPADIVTLDRVLCCFPDVENMVRLSVARSRKLYGLVYPRDTWWIKIGAAVMNFVFRLQKNPFRIFPHPTREVEEMIRENGFKRRFHFHKLIWQVVVYAH
jgi:2-polyprenyl-3-methyl-5-hydroxy-6-metoxy-1,4-benzoquinol methylase